MSVRRAAVTLLAVLALVALPLAVAPPAAALPSRGTACTWSELPASPACAEARVEDVAVACERTASGRSCAVTYHLTLTVEPSLCGTLRLGDSYTLRSCAWGGPHTAERWYVDSTSYSDADLVARPLGIGLCAARPGASAGALDCAAWMHPPVLLPRA